VRFYATMLQGSEEYSRLGSYDVTDKLKFSTQLHGGFGTATFEISVPRLRGSMLVHQFIGAECYVYDEYGRNVYEGRVIDADKSGDVVKLSVSGFYADGKHIKVPTLLWQDVGTTTGDVIRDCIALVPSWTNTNGIYVHYANVVVGPQDTDEEIKVNDMIERMLKLGYRTDNLAPAYFAIYQDKIPRLKIEQYSSYPNFFVYADSPSGNASSGLTMERLYNKVYVLVDDPAEDGVGPTLFPTPAEDAASQQRYGVREGVINAGEYGEDLGLDLRDLALEKYAYPQQSFGLQISGMVRTNGGSYVPNYVIKAGDTLVVSNMDEMAALSFRSGDPTSTLSGFVITTQYDASKGTMKLDLSMGDRKMDYLLSRLGLEGGLS